MSTCPSCGGILGRDCFNPQECAWITQSMLVNDAVENAMRQRDAADEYGEQMQSQYEEHLASIGFDPIAMGM